MLTNLFWFSCSRQQRLPDPGFCTSFTSQPTWHRVPCRRCLF